MRVRIIEDDQQVKDGLVNAFRREELDADGYCNVAAAVPEIDNDDFIILDYSLVSNQVQKSINDLTKRDDQGNITTRLVFFTGNTKEAEELAGQKEVFRIIKKPAYTRDIVKLVKLCKDIADFQWCIDVELSQEEPEKEGKFAIISSKIDIPLMVIDISYRVLYHNDAMVGIYREIKKGSLCYRCQNTNNNEACTTCLAKKAFERGQKESRLELKAIENEKSFFISTAIPLKNADNEVYAAVMYFIKDSSANMVATTYLEKFQERYLERIDSILRIFIQYGFTRARYFEVRHLPVEPDIEAPDGATIADRGRIMILRKANGEGLLKEDVIGKRIRFNEAKHPADWKIVTTTEKHPLGEYVDMSNTVNWARVEFRDCNKKIIAIIAADKRHGGGDKREKIGAVPTTGEATVTDDDLKFLDVYHHIMNTTIEEMVNTRRRERQLKDYDTMMKAEAKIAGAKTEKNALSVLLDACKDITHADDATLMLLSGDGKYLKKLSGAGRLSELWPERIDINKFTPPCVKTLIRYKDGGHKRLIIQDIDEYEHFSGTTCREFLYGTLSTEEAEEADKILKDRLTWACFVILYDERPIGTISLRFKEKYRITDYIVKMVETFISKSAPLLMVICVREQLEEYMRRMTHEIRGPISTMNQAASELTEGDLDAEIQRSILHKIRRESEFAYFLLENVRAIEDQFKPRLDAVLDNPASEIDYIIELYRDVAKSKGISITFNKNGFPVQLPFDRDAFRLVINNLLGNAVKYSDDDTEIAINNGIVDEWLSVTFANYGVGVVEDEKEIIFEKYRSGSNIKGIAYKSSGIGLYTAKKIMNLFDGDVEVLQTAKPTVFGLKFSMHSGEEDVK